jgi:hypothetical protein
MDRGFEIRARERRGASAGRLLARRAGRISTGAQGKDRTMFRTFLASKWRLVRPGLDAIS